MFIADFKKQTSNFAQSLAASLVLGAATLNAAGNEPKEPAPDLRRTFCASLLTRVDVLNVGFSDRDQVGLLSKYAPVVGPFAFPTRISTDGRVYSIPHADGIELRRVADRGPAGRVSLPDGYSVGALGARGEFIVAGNLGTRDRYPWVNLRVIASLTDREILNVSNPKGSERALRFGFMADRHLYVQSTESLSIYDLAESGAALVERVNFGDEKFTDWSLRPLADSPYFLKSGLNQAPVVLKGSNLKAVELLNPNPPPARPGQTTYGEYERMKRAFEDLGEKIDGSFEAWRAEGARVKPPRYADPQPSPRGTLAVVSAWQGRRNVDDAGTLESILTVFDLRSFRIVRTFVIPGRRVSQAAISKDERYLAWIGKDGFEVFDLHGGSEPVLSDVGGGAPVRELRWGGPRRVISNDAYGQILMRTMAL